MNRKQSLIWTLVMTVTTVIAIPLAKMFPENSTEQVLLYFVQILGVILIPIGILGFINGGKPIKELSEESKVKTKREQIAKKKKNAIHLISVGLSLNVVIILANYIVENFTEFTLHEYITYFLYANQGFGVLALITGLITLLFGIESYDENKAE